jgi:hypothetical protein
MIVVVGSAKGDLWGKKKAKVQSCKSEFFP